MKPLPAIIASTALVGVGWLSRGYFPTPQPTVVAPSNPVAEVPQTRPQAKQETTEFTGQTATTIESVIAQMLPMDRDGREQLARTFASQQSSQQLSTLTQQLAERDVRDLTADLLGQALWRRWVKLDLEAAWQVAMSVKVLEKSLVGADEVFGEMVFRNADLAWKRALALPKKSKDLALTVILDELGSKFPNRAFDFIDPDPNSHFSVSDTALQLWMKRDPDTALQRIAAMPPGEHRTESIYNAAVLMAAQNPRKSLEWAAGLPPEDKRSAQEAILSTIAEKNPTAALAELAGMQPNPSQRKGLMVNIYRQWGNSDFPSLLSHTQALTPSPERNAALTALGESLTKETMGTLLDAVGNLSVKDARLVLDNFQWHHVGDDVPGFLAKLESSIQNPQLRAAALEKAANSLQYGEPEAAAAIYKLIDPSRRDGVDLSYLLRNWASTDSDKAFAWMQQLPESKRGEALQGLAEGLSLENGPEKAFGFLATLSSPKDRSVFQAAFAKQWASQDPDKALAWGKTQGRETELTMIKQIIETNTGENTKLAVDHFNMLLATEGKDADLPQITSALASDLVQQDPQQALELLQSVPAGDIRNPAVDMMVREWVGNDPEQASKWVQALPPGLERDFAAAGLAVGIAKDDPESAFTWALSIQDENKKDTAIHQAISTWGNGRNEDFSELETLVQHGAFTPDQRELIQAQLKLQR